VRRLRRLRRRGLLIVYMRIGRICSVRILSSAIIFVDEVEGPTLPGIIDCQFGGGTDEWDMR
jgi:hypothetical protein